MIRSELSASAPASLSISLIPVGGVRRTTPSSPMRVAASARSTTGCESRRATRLAIEGDQPGRRHLEPGDPRAMLGSGQWLSQSKRSDDPFARAVIDGCGHHDLAFGRRCWDARQGPPHNWIGECWTGAEQTGSVRVVDGKGRWRVWLTGNRRELCGIKGNVDFSERSCRRRLELDDLGVEDGLMNDDRQWDAQRQQYQGRHSDNGFGDSAPHGPTSR